MSIENIQILKAKEYIKRGELVGIDGSGEGFPIRREEKPRSKIIVKGSLRGELNATGRAICRGCGHKLEKGGKRIVHKYQARFMVKDKLCPGCGLKIIDELLAQTQALRAWLDEE